MSRVPVVGGDKDAWGTVLNDYLAVAHDPDGSLKIIDASGVLIGSQGVWANSPVWVERTNPASVALEIYLTPDANDRLSIRADGMISWGAGGSTPVDTFLYRWFAGYLRTDADFVAETFHVEPRAAGDAYAYTAKLYGDTQNRIGITRSGQLQFGSGAAGWDTVLYRMNPGVLATDNALLVGGPINAGNYVRANNGIAGIEVVMGWGPAASSGACIQFGTANAWDTNLYRAAADSLKTDDAFTALSLAASGAGNALTLPNGGNIVLGTGTGTMLGTATGQKLGFWGKAPVVRPAGWSAATGTASRGGFATGSATATQVAQSLKGLIDDLMTIGILGA